MSRPHTPPPRIDLATLPPLLSTGDPHSFARFTLEERDPRILQDMEEAPYFSPDLTRAFKKFREEILEGLIRPLREDAPDTDFWKQISKPYIGRSWLDVPWYWAETFFYRRILEIVRYFQIGAWHERDPFAYQKDAELTPAAAPQRVRSLLQFLSGQEPPTNEQKFTALIHSALWGNRVDLSYNVEHKFGRAARLEDERENLLVDDAARVWDYISTHKVNQLVYVADNAGTELALDLAFIEFLLASNLVAKLTLHLKPQPFYVSDAMPQDVERTLAALEKANEETRGLARLLRAHLKTKRLELRVHWFYPTSLHYFEMPDDLFDLFRAADFVILKGDVNYRRVVGDAHWKPTLAFEYPTRYLPTPFVCLRTMKSDAIVGLKAAQVEELDRTDAQWRVNGKRGVAQANLNAKREQDMKLFKYLFPILFLLTFSTFAVSAQDRSVVVQRRDADMTINTDGSVDVVETWEVDFEGGPFRFAFRSIPINRVSSIVFEGVSEDGSEYLRAGSETPNTYTVDVENGERIITWYFPPTTDATRTFQVRYKLYDALRIYEDGDQFWWKFIESDRGYPVQSSRVTLHLPANFPTDELDATTYTNGRETEGAQIVDGQTIVFEGGPFPPNTEWEIRAKFPHGVITQSVQPWQAAEDVLVAEEERAAIATEQFDFYSTFATLLILIGGGLGLLVLWYLRGRDRPVALPAEYLNAPPLDPSLGEAQLLTPALAGTLIDEEANVRDVLATLIDWAERGIIKIRALPQGVKTSDPNDDYVYERIGTDAPPLKHAYERELMKRLWHGESSRNIGYIREKFTGSLKGMFDDLYDELVRLDYFPARPDRVRSQFYRFGWLLLVLICPAAFLFQFLVLFVISEEASFSWSAIAPWLALFLIAGGFMFISRYLPRKTTKGAEAAAKWNAFKRYLEQIDKYTNVAEAKEQFEKYLPYAVAFGIDKSWVEKFSAVNTPAPAWYSPPPVTRGFTTVSSSRPSTSTASPSRPSSGSMFPSDALPTGSASGSSGAPGVPSLDDAAGGAFNSLNNVSSSFFSMLNTTATSFVASNPRSSPSSRSSRSGSSRSSWSGGGSSFRSSSGGSRSSGGGSRGGGGGRSGFG